MFGFVLNVVRVRGDSLVIVALLQGNRYLMSVWHRNGSNL